MKKKTLALICVLTLLLGGCAPDTANKKNNNHPETEHVTLAEDIEDSVNEADSENNSAVTITYEQISKTYQSADGTTVLTTEYNRPTITIPGNEDAAEAITAFFAENEKAFWKTAESYRDDAVTTYVDNQDIFPTYYLAAEFETFRCDDAVLSLRCCISDFMGGTHGNYNYTGMNFDIQTGELLSLNSISNDKDALLDSSRAYIESQLKLPAYEEGLMDTPENLRETVQEYVLTNDTWYFTNSGLTFVSNIYVLAPYAAGAFFFTVPYQQLEGLKSEYQYTGPFELYGPIGSTLSADIDSDENIDAIYYNAAYKEDTNELSITLIINGKDFSSLLQDESCQLTIGAVGEYDLEYYLMDLDTADDFIELAILDRGSSNDLNTYFFRYERGDLTLLGSIQDLPCNPSFHVNGDGTFTANMPIALLENLYTHVTYELTDKEEIALIPQEWYAPIREDYPQEYISHKLLRDVIVYTENDLHSNTITLIPSDGPVQFPATDNEHWVMLKTASENTYYLYLTDFTTLESGEFTWDVFENLILSD